MTGKYLPICNFSAGFKFSVNLFDVVNNELEENIFTLQTDGFGYMNEFTSDEEGFYFVCKDYEEDSFTLRKYNYEKKNYQN